VGGVGIDDRWVQSGAMTMSQSVAVAINARSVHLMVMVMVMVRVRMQAKGKDSVVIMVLCGRFNQAREVEPPAIFAQLDTPTYSTLP